MSPRQRILSVVARQLGHPTGRVGRLVGRLLNRGNKNAITAAVEALAPGSAERVADVGFGGGLGLKLLLGRTSADGRVVGADISAVMIESASREFAADISAGRLQLLQAGLEKLPLDDSSLDGVVTVNTLYFLSDLGPALTEMRRVLRPGGRLVIGLNDPAAMRKMPFTEHGFNLRPVGKVIDELEERGFLLREHRELAARAEPFHVLLAIRSEDH
jgi:arsenite methyltransferase